LPYTLPSNASKPGGLTDVQLLKRNISRFLQSAGLNEALTYSLISKKDINRLLSPDVTSETYSPVSLAMPLSEDHQYLRLSILPELVNRLSYNRARKQANLGFYEIGSVFLSKEEKVSKQPHEQLRLSAALTGSWIDHKWQGEHKSVDFYLVKGILEELFNYLNISVIFTQSKLVDMHPGRCATLSINDKVIGFVGQVHPTLAKEKDLKETYVFDLNLEYILNSLRPELAYEPIPKYPSIVRDVAFVVKQEVLAGDIEEEIVRIGAPLVKRVEAFDVYVGEN